MVGCKPIGVNGRSPNVVVSDLDFHGMWSGRGRGNRGVEKVHNEDLNDLYSSPNNFRVMKSRRMRWAGHVALMGERRGVYGVLGGEPDGKRPLGRPRHKMGG